MSGNVSAAEFLEASLDRYTLDILLKNKLLWILKYQHIFDECQLKISQ